MQTKFLSVLISCLIVTSVFSQVNLNDYKYVIVAKKYDFLKEADQYQLNSLSEFLFNKYGFQAFIEGEEYPQDLLKNRCLALNANMLKESGIFKTKLILELLDCNDKVLYTSPVGESREKEFKKAYTEATRNAFKHIEKLNYKYEPKEKTEVVLTQESGTVNNEVTKEIQKLKEEIQTLKKEKEPEVLEVVTPVVEPEPKVEKVKAVKKRVDTAKELTEIPSDILYAQVTENGFQLVDNTPKVVFRISATGANNVYLVENESAIIYKQKDEWIYETLANGMIKQKVLNIKF